VQVKATGTVVKGVGSDPLYMAPALQYLNPGNCREARSFTLIAAKEWLAKRTGVLFPPKSTD